MMHTRTLLLALTVSLCAGCAGEEFHGVLVDPPRQAPEIVAANWDGEEFRLSDQRGRVVILFFGYTSCPDVCPMTLSRMKRLYGELGVRSDDVAVVFISVDPDRDAPEKLATYVPGFDDRFYGLYLEGDSLDAVTEAYDVVVKLHAPRSRGGYYAVDHTGTLFVIDPEGMLRVNFAHDAAVEDVLPDVLQLLGSTEASAALKGARG